MRRRAFTLTEVLVVVAILAILAAILFPVFRRARLSAYQASCTSNLRQASAALNLYMDASDGKYPMTAWPSPPYHPARAVAPITGGPGTPATGILRCPLDQPGGRNGQLPADKREPLSYAATWFLWEGETGVKAWDALTALEPNPILFRCYFHDDRTRAQMMTGWQGFYGTRHNGLALVARKDGSVGFDRRSDSREMPNGQPDEKGSVWTLATALPCPPEICDGKPPENGTRL